LARAIVDFANDAAVRIFNKRRLPSPSAVARLSRRNAVVELQKQQAESTRETSAKAGRQKGATMVEAKVEASVRTPRTSARDDYRYDYRYESASLSRFSQALGDLCGAFLEPFDRALGCCPVAGPVRGGSQGAAFDRDVEREQLESQTVAELKETADNEGIDLGDAHLKADIVNKVLRARAAKAKASSEV
jgi:hypothetical protein